MSTPELGAEQNVDTPGIYTLCIIQPSLGNCRGLVTPRGQRHGLGWVRVWVTVKKPATHVDPCLRCYLLFKTKVHLQ